MVRDPSRISKWLYLVAACTAFLLLVAGVAVTIFGGRTASKPAESDVLLILVLPGEDGIVLPRTIDRHRIENGTPGISSLDPMSTVTIPGTGLNLLRDIYPFEGPSGLADAVASDSLRPAYVVLDEMDLDRLTSESKLTVLFPTQIDVFDGEQMFTFPQGRMALDATQIGAMLRGVEYLESPDRLAITEELGVELARVLSIANIPHSDVDTDLTADEFTRWRADLGLIDKVSANIGQR